MWYRMKRRAITRLAEKMLKGGLGPNEAHQIPDSTTSLTIPSALVTMERLYDGRYGTGEYDIKFATPNIAQVVADVQETARWTNSWETLSIFFRNRETRVAAGKLFQRMFLRKFRKQDPNKMPECYELRPKDGPNPETDSANAATMPWNDLRQQPTLSWISVGKDTDGSLYSKKELKEAIEAVILKPPSIRFLIPCGENWASWDAALFIGKHRKNGVNLHVVFLQLTVNPNHDILAKGLNQVRDAILPEPKGVWIYYHYVLVLLTQHDEIDQLNIPTWRPVLDNSKDRKIDESWDMKTLMQYIMFVPRTALVKPVLLHSFGRGREK